MEILNLHCTKWRHTEVKKKIVNYKEVDGQLWYRVKWVGYQDTTQEPKDNLKNTIKKVEEYYKKTSQAVKKRKD